MEVDVLKSLDYEVGNPTIKTFLRLVYGKSCLVDSRCFSIEQEDVLLYIHMVKAY